MTSSSAPNTPAQPDPTLEQWLQTWRARVREPGPWVERFRRLAEDIASAENAPSACLCDELEALLAAYVEAMARQQEPVARYLDLKRHLEHCARCRELAAALRAARSDACEAEPGQPPTGLKPGLRDVPPE